MSKILDKYLPEPEQYAVDLVAVGHAIRERREALGLTQAQLARMSGLSRQTLVGLENGSLNDLGFNRVGSVLAILGLDFDTLSLAHREKKRGLWMAAKTASVSYAKEMTAAALERSLLSGDVPPPYAGHLAHLLEETPLSIVVMAVEEAAAHEHVPPQKVWKNVARMASSLSSTREGMWG